jgi:hypothetical protein
VEATTLGGDLYVIFAVAVRVESLADVTVAHKSCDGAATDGEYEGSTSLMTCPDTEETVAAFPPTITLKLDVAPNPETLISASMFPIKGDTHPDVQDAEMPDLLQRKSAAFVDVDPEDTTTVLIPADKPGGTVTTRAVENVSEYMTLTLDALRPPNMTAAGCEALLLVWTGNHAAVIVTV